MRKFVLGLACVLIPSLAAAQSYTFTGTAPAWMAKSASLTLPPPTYPDSTNVISGTAGKDILQILRSVGTSDANGPAWRFTESGDLLTHHSLTMTGSTISGTGPGVPYMVYIQSDLAADQPLIAMDSNISADMRQPYVWARGNGIVRFYVDSYGKMWLRGQDASLEVSKSGGSGPLELWFQGQPTTTGDNQPIATAYFKSNTGDVVGTLQMRSRADNSGGKWVLQTKQPSGALYDAMSVSNALVNFLNLSGHGDTHVCVHNNGDLFTCP